jgi:hypothetical protein
LTATRYTTEIAAAYASRFSDIETQLAVLRQGLPVSNDGVFSLLDYGAVASNDPNPAASITDANASAWSQLRDAVAAAGGGTILLPPGRYPFRRSTSGGCIDLAGLAGMPVHFRGYGATLALVGDCGFADVNIVRLPGVSNIVFEGITFSQRDALNVNEQCHMVACPSKAANDTIVFNRCRFIEGKGSFQTPDPDLGVRGGDGIQVAGESTSRQTNWWCFQCTFDGFYRSGIAVQRGVYGLHVLNCLFRNTSAGTGSCLDFEGTGHDSDGECVIVGNRFEHRKGTRGVTLSGVSGALPNYRTIFAHNICVDCTVHMADVNGLLIDGNMIVGDTHTIRPALYLQGIGDNTRIVNNYLELTAGAANAPVLQITGQNNRFPNGILILGNEIQQHKGATAVEIEHASNITFSGNRVTYHGSKAKTVGVNYVCKLVQARGSFCDNEFTAARQGDGVTPAPPLQAGVQVDAPTTEAGASPTIKVGAILINNNRLHRCTWVLTTPRPLTDWAAGPPVIAGNTMVGGSDVIDSSQLKFYIAFGTGGPGTYAHYVGYADPTSMLPATQGSTCTWLNGNSSAEYFKSSATDASGWRQRTIP